MTTLRTMLDPREWIWTGDRAYRRDVALWMAAYAAVLIPVIFVMNANPEADWRWAIAWLPIVPCILLVTAWLRFYRRLDEREKTIALETLAFAFGATALLTFGYGFLQAAGAPDVSWFAVWPVMAVLWIIGGQLAKRRYE